MGQFPLFLCKVNYQFMLCNLNFGFTVSSFSYSLYITVFNFHIFSFFFLTIFSFLAKILSYLQPRAGFILFIYSILVSKNTPNK